MTGLRPDSAIMQIGRATFTGAWGAWPRWHCQAQRGPFRQGCATIAHAGPYAAAAFCATWGGALIWQ